MRRWIDRGAVRRFILCITVPIEGLLVKGRVRANLRIPFVPLLGSRRVLPSQEGGSPIDVNHPVNEISELLGFAFLFFKLVLALSLGLLQHIRPTSWRLSDSRKPA